MPREYSNYSFVIDSNFQPFTMQEMLTPFVMYKDAFDQAEAAYTDLSDKADTFKYLSDTLPEGSRAKEIYDGYANYLHEQAQDFAKHGLNMGNRRALTDLKRRYQGEIGRLSKADEALRQERELRRKLAAQDSSILYADDNLTIDSFLDNETPNLYSISGNELYTKGAAAGKAASSRVYGAEDAGSTLGGYYRDYVQRMGYNADTIAKFRQDMSTIPELQMAADAILEANGVNSNLTGVNLDRARQQVINGMIDGAVYTESHNPTRDLGKLTRSEQASLDMQREQMNKSAAMNGLTWDNNTKSWVYDIEKDPSAQRQIAVQKWKNENKVKDSSSSSGGGSSKSSSGKYPQNENTTVLEWDTSDRSDDATISVISKDSEAKDIKGVVAKRYDDLDERQKEEVDKAIGDRGNYDEYEYYETPHEGSWWFGWGPRSNRLYIKPRKVVTDVSESDEEEDMDFN